jgi:hypothetical protein
VNYSTSVLEDDNISWAVNGLAQMTYKPLNARRASVNGQLALLYRADSVDTVFVTPANKADITGRIAIIGYMYRLVNLHGH